jgi:hypothetical protein
MNWAIESKNEFEATGLLDYELLSKIYKRHGDGNPATYAPFFVLRATSTSNLVREIPRAVRNYPTDWEGEFVMPGTLAVISGEDLEALKGLSNLDHDEFRAAHGTFTVDVQYVPQDTTLEFAGMQFQNDSITGPTVTPLDRGTMATFAVFSL